MNPAKYYKQPKIEATLPRIKTSAEKKSCLSVIAIMAFGSLIVFGFIFIPEPYNLAFGQILFVLFIIIAFAYQVSRFSILYSKQPILFHNDFQELIIEGKKPLILKDADRITFLYMGDGKKGDFFSQSLVRKLSLDDSHNRFFVDHLKFNHETIFFRITSKTDKENYFNFINQMHYFNPLTKLIIGRDEIPLPVDPEQVFLVNENRQLLK